MIKNLIKLLSCLLFYFPVVAQEKAIVHVDFKQPLNTMRGGIGASWHAIEKPMPDYGNGYAGNPPHEDTAAWAQVYRHANWLGFDWMRVEITQVMYEPERRQFDWTNREMQNLYRILDWCEKYKVDVILQQMRSDVAWNTFPEWRNDPVKVCHSGPYSVEDFAEGLTELMDHLVKKKGYTCIKWLNITNEPPYWWKQPSNQPLSLAPALEAVRKGLDSRQIAVGLVAPDWVPVPALDSTKIDFDHAIGGYDLHEYFAYFDWQKDNPPTKSNALPLSVWEKRLADWAAFAHRRGKPFFLSELGSNLYNAKIGDPSPTNYESSLMNAEIVVRGLNTGTDAFSRWSFVNRAETGAQWQTIDTYDNNTKRFLKTITPHVNIYYLYGLLSRFIAKNSTVFATTVSGGTTGKHQRMFAAALRSPKGQTTIAVINDGENGFDVSFDVGERLRLYRYVITQADADRNDVVIAPEHQLRTKGKFRAQIPPKSLCIYTTYHLKHSDPGIIVE